MHRHARGVADQPETAGICPYGIRGETIVRVLTLLLFWLGLLACGSVAAQSTFPGDNFGAIPDAPGAGPRNYGPARDIPFVATGPGSVLSVMVSFSAAHTFVGDLRVRLIAPDGRQHLLFETTGGTSAEHEGFSANLAAGNTYRFADSFPANWWTAAAVGEADIPGTDARTVVAGGAGVPNPAPVTSLDATFAGAAVAGIWILRFDDGFGAEVGSVTAASLTLTVTGDTHLVTSTSDNGAGSLRQMMLDATPGDVIRFDANLFATPQTIALQTALPDITSNLAIQGPGADLLSVRRSDTAGPFRVFNNASEAASFSLSGLTVSNGLVNDSGGGVHSLGPLTLDRVHVVGNRALLGGGVAMPRRGGTISRSTISANVSTINGGGILITSATGEPVRIQDSTISGNRALQFVGGILFAAFEGASSVLELVNCTVVQNQASNSVGGILTLAASEGATAGTSLRNSIIAENRPGNLEIAAQGGASAGAASMNSLGFNLSDDYAGLTTLASDVTALAQLGPLALQGGSTPTHVPLGGSPALDAGHSSGAGFDQREQARAFDIGSLSNAGDGGDIGAVEAQAILASQAEDSGAGSLRAAVEAANANGVGLDDILFDGVFLADARAIALQTALPTIASSVSLNGPGADRLMVRRGDGVADFRVFNVDAGPSSIAAFSGMTISNGRVAGFGGGIQSYSRLSLSHVTVSQNHATDAGGVLLAFASGLISASTIHSNTAEGGAAGVTFQGHTGHLLRVGDSTFSGNSSPGIAPALFHLNAEVDSTLEVINSTINGNSAGGGASGIVTQVQGSGTGGITTIRNSLLANNIGGNLAAISISGPAVMQSNGFNLADDDSSAHLDALSDQNTAIAGLRPLALHGGSTPTHAIEQISDALDGGNGLGSGSQQDQRGFAFARSVNLFVDDATDGDGTDVGAFEAQDESLPVAGGFAADYAHANWQRLTQDFGCGSSIIFASMTYLLLETPFGCAKIAATYTHTGAPVAGSVSFDYVVTHTSEANYTVTAGITGSALTTLAENQPASGSIAFHLAAGQGFVFENRKTGNAGIVRLEISNFVFTPGTALFRSGFEGGENN